MGRRINYFRILLYILLISASSCSSDPTNSSAEIQKYSDNQVITGCKNMLDNYCSQLYSPVASGNLIIDRKKPIQILQGETQNQHSQTFYRYAQAKIKNKLLLPPDFLIILNEYSYFEKLESYLRRSPIQKMTIEERLKSDNLSYELDGIWQSAIDQTVLTRLSKKYKGFHQIPQRLMPIEYEVEEKRTRRILISEFSKVLWKNDKNWKKVTEGFKDLKKSFFTLFEKLDIPKEVHDSWKEKIASLQLVLPGSLPEISDEECSTTTINAYYYKELNLITVCAGDFNSEDVVLTLAHEMSHSLGIDRDLYAYLKKSNLGTALTKLRSHTCSASRKYSCEDWAQLKADLPKLTSEIQDYEPPLIDFDKCLKRNANTVSIGDKDLDRISTKLSKDRIVNFASSNLFLRLIKDKLPMKNGKLQKNPNFMNPCSYYLWSRNEESIDDEIYSLIFFATEYKCNAEGTEEARLTNAINVSGEMTTKLLKSVLKAEGEFSDRKELTSENFASPPFERSADVIGTYAVAEYLNKFDTQRERRTKYLASASWLCQEPSLETNYPSESKVLQRYSQDSHAQGEARKMELLSKPIRKTLRCEKDFIFSECSLPFK